MAEEKNYQSIIKKEVRFETAKSSGPGGQNTNKKNTKVTGLWNFAVSKLISADDKEKIISELKNKILARRVLMVSSQKHRSQLDNKKEVVEAIIRLVKKALKVKPLRIPTKPPAVQKEKIIASKKIHSETKKLRSRIKY